LNLLLHASLRLLKSLHRTQLDITASFRKLAASQDLLVIFSVLILMLFELFVRSFQSLHFLRQIRFETFGLALTLALTLVLALGLAP
jgi:hypothetical protein